MLQPYSTGTKIVQYIFCKAAIYASYMLTLSMFIYFSTSPKKPFSPFTCYLLGALVDIMQLGRLVMLFSEPS